LHYSAKKSNTDKPQTSKSAAKKAASQTETKKKDNSQSH